MGPIRRLVVATAAIAASLLAVASAGALAAFPDFTGCPTANPAVTACLDIESTDGFLDIKGFRVPIGTSFALRGGLIPNANEGVGPATFVAPTNGSGVFSKPIQIPGGILGIDFAIPGNAVTATAQLAGSASNIRVDPAELFVSIPVKLKLDNPILGSNCFIGSNSNPVRLNLTVGTTSPPPPNRPISGHAGEVSFDAAGHVLFLGNVNVDNAFAVPGATGCGLGLGLVNALINAKLGLPSAAGNNTVSITNDVGLGPA
jgi:hypothetical protein